MKEAAAFFKGFLYALVAIGILPVMLIKLISETITFF